VFITIYLKAEDASLLEQLKTEMQARHRSLCYIVREKLKESYEKKKEPTEKIE
jgi:hypothetical protein